MAIIYRCDRCKADHTESDEHGKVQIERDYSVGTGNDCMIFSLCKRCRTAVQAFITNYDKVRDAR